MLMIDELNAYDDRGDMLGRDRMNQESGVLYLLISVHLFNQPTERKTYP